MATSMHAALNPTNSRVAIPVAARTAPPVAATNTVPYHIHFVPLNAQKQALSRSRTGWKHAREQRTSCLRITCNSNPSPLRVDTKNGSSHSESLPDSQEDASSAEPYTSDIEQIPMDEEIPRVRYNISSNPDRSDSISAESGQWYGWEASAGGSFHGWGPVDEPAQEPSPTGKSSGRRWPAMAAGKSGLLHSGTER